MSFGIEPSPAPWTTLPASGGVILVVSTGGASHVTVAACDGGASEANAELICAAPEMMAAVLAGNLALARAALTERGLA